MHAPLNLHAAPAAGFDQPLELLLACHQRVERMLGLLARLHDHVAVQGCDTQAAQAAVDVMRYFDLAGPAHHEDEERHLFPLLAASGDAALVALAARLQQEHLAMATQWQAVRADLQAVAAAAPETPRVDPDRRARWQAFATLYRGHVAAEEALAYPAAMAGLDAPARAAMGDEMARRRGLR